LFEQFATGIDGLDALLGGGVRYPQDTAAFMFLTGDAGTGKTLLGLELLTRAWWRDDRGGRTFLYYSVEQAPQDLQKKLVYDFGDYFGAPNEVRVIDGDNPLKICLETDAASGGCNRLVLTQAAPASSDSGAFTIDIDWIQAEVGNYGRASEVGMVCIDNTGLLLNDLEYFDKRSALVRTRLNLMRRRIHGIFILEEGQTGAARFPSAEELSTDVLIHLSFVHAGGFKSRTLEILKARHQYYYRGEHHFSIAGRGVNRQLYLGARGERGPGVHIYPSISAQLSIARDSSQLKVPRRGDTPISLGLDAMDRAFKNDTGPATLSSTIALVEPGTHYTSFAMRFLARGIDDGEAGLLVSTKEDGDAILRICRHRERLRPMLDEDGEHLSPLFRLLYLHPEFLSAGKFTSDILRMVEKGQDERKEPKISRLAFDNVYQLHRRFPLLGGQDFMIPALLDLLRFQQVTPMFIDLVPQGRNEGELAIDPSLHLSTFDNVLHLFLKKQGTKHIPHVCVLKSVGNDFDRSPFPVLI